MIISLDQVYNFIQYTDPVGTDTVFDNFVTDLILSETERLENMLNFKIENSFRTYITQIKSATDKIYIPEKVVTAVTSVETSEDFNTWVSKDFTLVNDMILTTVAGNQFVRITYTAGYATVPAILQQALVQLVVFALNQSAYSKNTLGLTSKSVSMNGQSYNISVNQKDFLKDIQEMIKSYVIIERNNYL